MKKQNGEEVEVRGGDLVPVIDHSFDGVTPIQRSNMSTESAYREGSSKLSQPSTPAHSISGMVMN